jgi:hypothetical protein
MTIAIKTNEKFVISIKIIALSRKNKLERLIAENIYCS